MDTADLGSKIADDGGLTSAAANALNQDIFIVIADIAIAGDRIWASGFGKFQGRGQCEGCNPSTVATHRIVASETEILAPDFTTAILEGKQPVELTRRPLMRVADLPLAWDQQRVALGFR